MKNSSYIFITLVAVVFAGFFDWVDPEGDHLSRMGALILCVAYFTIRAIEDLAAILGSE